MNAGLIHAEEEARRDAAPEIIKGDPVSSAGFFERRLIRHSDALALAVVAGGFVLRIFAATRSYLNPDEALHYILLNQSSAFLAYKASLTNAHPPLIYLVLYYWRFLGRTELMLRLPSVLAGTAFCWLIYKWLGLAFGRAASWIGLLLVTFSPAMVDLSAELRAYALLLFCIGGALYFLERAFAEKSVREMWFFSGFLYLAILSHYSAVFFAAAAGVYALARISDSHLPRRAIVAWALGQAGALAICAFLYETHLSKIKNSIAVWSMSFGTAYFHPDTVSIFAFTKENTVGIFLFLFRERYVALLMLWCFIAGVALVFARGLLSRQGNLQSSRLGILLLLPFPRGLVRGNRRNLSVRWKPPHCVSGAVRRGRCELFGSCGIWSAALGGNSCCSARAGRVKYISRVRSPTEEMTEKQSPALMASAMGYLEQSVPPGDHILVDYQSSLPLAYYLCGPKVIFPIETFTGKYFEYSCNGYSVVSLNMWKVIPQNFRLQFEKMARSHSLRPGDRVWLYQTGWGADVATELAGHDPAFRCLAPKRFGSGITVTPFIVGPDLSPEPPLGAC